MKPQTVTRSHQSVTISPNLIVGSRDSYNPGMINFKAPSNKLDEKRKDQIFFIFKFLRENFASLK